MLLGELKHCVDALCSRERNNVYIEEARRALQSLDISKIQLLDRTPFDFVNPHDYLEYAQLRDLLRKTEGLRKGSFLEEAAKASFYECESQCFKSNKRLSRLDLYPALMPFFDEARRLVRTVLGPKPPRNVLDSAKHGKGTTFSTSSRTSTVPDKMMEPAALTPDAWPILSTFALSMWRRSMTARDIDVNTVYGNRFTTVPKDSTKHRGICIEPSLNLFYQLSIGSFIKRALKVKAGVDLYDGQERQRRAAKEASAFDTWCTIDLSNASDTVSQEIVRLLLPSEWFNLLDSLRCKKTLIDGRWVVLEKFSSMGNGFTFELETLIYWALCRASGSETSLVYGDDIIVEKTRFREVIEALRFCGFTPNMKKTFNYGPFRESCGGDYFFGEDVRPHFLKAIPHEPSEYIALANGLNRVREKFPRAHPFHRDLLCAWRRIISSLPTDIRRLRGPKALGDVTIHTAEERRWSSRRFDNGGKRKTRSCTEQHIVGTRYLRVYAPINHFYVGWEHFHPEVTLASALLGVGDGRLGVMPRDNVTGYGFKWIPFG